MPKKPKAIAFGNDLIEFADSEENRIACYENALRDTVVVSRAFLEIVYRCDANCVKRSFIGFLLGNTYDCSLKWLQDKIEEKL